MKFLTITLFSLGLMFFTPSSKAAEDQSCEELLKINQPTNWAESDLSRCFEQTLESRKGLGSSSPRGKISSEDKAPVKNYMDTWAYLINLALRTKDDSYVKKNSKKLDRLDQSLKKFPTYTGFVFRGSEYAPTKDLRKGVVYTDPAFLSTSLDFEIAQGYAGVDGYISVVLSKSGKALSYDDSNQDLSVEKEILFPRNVSYKIIDIRKDEVARATFVFLIEL